MTLPWKVLAKGYFKQRAIRQSVRDALRIAEATLYELTRKPGVSIAVERAYQQIAPVAFAVVPGLSEEAPGRCVLENFLLEPGKAIFQGRGPHWAMHYLAGSLAETMNEAPNYMTAEFTIGPAHGDRFEVLVRRLGQGKSAHALRTEAETRVKALEAELADLRAPSILATSRPPTPV